MLILHSAHLSLIRPTNSEGVLFYTHWPRKAVHTVLWSLRDNVVLTAVWEIKTQMQPTAVDLPRVFVLLLSELDWKLGCDASGMVKNVTLKGQSPVLKFWVGRMYGKPGQDQKHTKDGTADRETIVLFCFLSKGVDCRTTQQGKNTLKWAACFWHLANQIKSRINAWNVTKACSSGADESQTGTSEMLFFHADIIRTS